MAKKIFTDVVIETENKKDGEIPFQDFGPRVEPPFQTEEEFDSFFMNEFAVLKL